MGLQWKISDVSDQWFLPTDVQYLNQQIAYAWHPARPTCGRRSTKCWVLSSTPTNHPQVSDFFAVYTLLPLLTDRLFPCVCICHERSGDAYLNTCIIHRAQSSTCACKVLNIRQRRLNCKEWWSGSSSIVLIWESWSFLRWRRQNILCGKDTCCNLCCWLRWMCVTGKSRSVRLSISSLGRS